MKINDLKVDGFGIWSDLKLEDLSPGVTAFYGANEAGKTTLMQFVRAMLYGYNDDRRQRYLSSVDEGGITGGSLNITGAGGTHTLTRRGDRHHLGSGQVTITAPDGTIQGNHFVKTLLGDVDEATFNNIFAIGLREMQELGSLGDSDAAQWLFRLSSGMDRVSLVDVVRELRTSRDRILAADDRPSVVSQLMSQRAQLQTEVDELRGTTARWARLREEAEGTLRDTARLEQERDRLEKSSRAVEAAIAVREKWVTRAALDEQLAALAPASDLSLGAVERLATIKSKLATRGARRETLRAERQRVSDEADLLPINEALWRQAPRIEALSDQQQWIASIDQQCRQLETEVSELQLQLNVEQEGLGWKEGSLPPQVSSTTMTILRPSAKACKAARQRMESALEEARRKLEIATALDAEISVSLAGSGEDDLSEALEAAGDRVGLLRRRIFADERIDQLQHSRTELQQQSGESLEQQMMPIWAFAALGGVFVFGVVLIFAQFILPGSVIGTIGWALAILGVFATGAAGLTKLMLERSAANRLTACHRQLDLVGRQLEQAEQERDALDKELPRGGGPLASRLQTAERELERLEELLPLDVKRQAAIQEGAAAEQSTARAKIEFQTARQAWRSALINAGLPETITPQQIRALVGRGEQISEIRRLFERRSEELEQRRREIAGVTRRVEKLLNDLGTTPDGATLVEHVDQLVAALNEQESRVVRRETLNQKARELKREEARYVANLKKLHRWKASILREAGVETEEAYLQLAAQFQRRKSLRDERDTIVREIAAALGIHTTEEEVAQVLSTTDGSQLESRWEKLTAEIEEIAARQQQLGERRGRLLQQQTTLAEDRKLPQRLLELSTVETRLEKALEQWQVRAVTGALLEIIRQEFEQHRQPETLMEASGYLSRLTQGHYVRVWTPLGEDVLYVDDRDGSPRTVDTLSRGTREQLFLSLRLALVALYARRGLQLPLVLDDVLVNFDADRAGAAAAVLRDFAKAGHQLLVFTCHEHVWKMFKKMKLDARRLPSFDIAAKEVIEEEKEEILAIELPVEKKEVVAEEPEEEEYVEDEYEWEEEEEEPTDLAAEAEEDEYEEEDEADEEEYEYEEEEEADAEESEVVDEQEEDELEEEAEVEEEVEADDSDWARGWEVEYKDEWNEGSEAA